MIKQKKYKFKVDYLEEKPYYRVYDSINLLFTIGFQGESGVEIRGFTYIGVSRRLACRGKQPVFILMKKKEEVPCLRLQPKQQTTAPAPES